MFHQRNPEFCDGLLRGAPPFAMRGAPTEWRPYETFYFSSALEATVPGHS